MGTLKKGRRAEDVPPAATAAVRLVLGTTSRGQTVALSGVEAAAHKLVVGVTGMGKSKLFASLFVQLLNQCVDCCVLDLHGDLADDSLSLLVETGFFAREAGELPYQRLRYLDFTRQTAFPPFNILSQPYPPHQVAASVLEAIKRGWPSLASGDAPMLENLTLYGSFVLTVNHAPLTQLPLLLTDATYRAQLLRAVADPDVRAFFARFDSTGTRGLTEGASTLRRLSLLTFAPALKYSLGQPANVLRMRELMDQGVSVIVNLGGLDPETQRFLAALIAIGVEEAALSRADLPEGQRRPYHFLGDEFAQYGARSGVALERILSLTRKYGLSLTLACQMLAQVPADVRSALNQTTFIALRLGQEDAAWGAERLATIDAQRVTHTARGTPTYMSAAEQRAEWERLLTGLPPRHAVLRLDQQTVPFRTLGVLATRGGSEALAAVKERYTQLYLTPLDQLLRPQEHQPLPIQPPPLVSPQQQGLPTVRRRVPLAEEARRARQ